MLDRALKLWRAMLKHLAGTGDATVANVEQRCSSANWQTLNQVRALAIAQRRQLRGHHGALRLGQMAALEIRADNIGKRVDAVEGFEPGLHAREETGLVAVSAVEDFSLESNDRFDKGVLLDIGRKLGTLVRRMQMTAASPVQTYDQKAAAATHASFRARAFGKFAHRSVR